MSDFVSELKKKIVSALCLPLKARGFSEYMAWDWIKRRLEDYKAPSPGIIDKLTAHSRGFLSFRLDQYGINRSNYKRFISDRDYMFLHPINEHYKKWFDDKLSFKQILNRYDEYLPEYYFHIKAGAPKAYIPLSSLLIGVECSANGILTLLREKRELALKPVRGTHGDGFYRLGFSGNLFYVNLRPSNENAILSLIANLEQDYLVTEYIKQHRELDRIYSGAVSTIRLITINKRGSGTLLAEAYLRIGSKRTGAVDNLGAGGMMAAVDVNTGHYGSAKAVAKAKIYPCATHPDTGALIDGELPHWELVKQKVLEIADYVPQLEYMGFDCSVTENGFKIIEINTFPDLPRIQLIGETLHDYLQEKIDYKKANRKQFAAALSELGGSYEKWFEDKASVRYILDFLPKKQLTDCYFHLVNRDGEPVVLKMPDCPAGYGTSVREVLRLVREMRMLALRPIESKIKGLDWLSYENGEYYVDGRKTSSKNVIQKLLSAGGCLVTEYPPIHAGIAVLYGSSTIIRFECVADSVDKAYLINSRASTELDITYGWVLNNISNDPNLNEAEIPYWRDLCSAATSIAQTLPQLGRIELDFIIINSGIKLIGCRTPSDESKADNDAAVKEKQSRRTHVMY